MTAPNITVWRHGTAIAGDDGIAWFGAGNEPGTHAISGGGFANGLTTANASNTDVLGADISAACPMAASFPVDDSAVDRTGWYVGFVAPPGAQLRAHVFAILAAS